MTLNKPVLKIMINLSNENATIAEVKQKLKEAIH